MLSHYSTRKNANQDVSCKIKKHLSEKRFERFAHCCSFLQIKADEDLKKKKVVRSDSCGMRFCPMCSHQKAKKDAIVLDVLMRYISKEHDKQFLFITLTTPNVQGEDLGSEITRFNKAFARLLKLKEVQAVNKGCVRKLEVTYNKERQDFNPHFHVLMAVNPSYFTHGYIKKDQWLDFWRVATKDPSIMRVDVRKVKFDCDLLDANTGEVKLSNKIVNEMATYATKADDYKQDEQVFDYFYMGLKGRQIITYNGIFKVAKSLHDKGELDHYKAVDLTEYVFILLYSWGYDVSNQSGNGKYIEEVRLKLHEKNEKTEDVTQRLSEAV